MVKVAVPRHWSYKRKYLSGKRGIEKPPFELPEFIRKTGIMEMREALQQKENEQGLKAKMRQRVRPKLGKIDIDYQKLHDAFFRYQTKPKMSRHGDIYYEVVYHFPFDWFFSSNYYVSRRELFDKTKQIY